MNKISPEKYEVINENLIIKWKNGEETFLDFKTIRDNCPCAECSGEKDAFGNVYMGYGKAKNESGYNLLGIKQVGYYGFQFNWGDGHNSGIYRFELLKNLDS